MYQYSTTTTGSKVILPAAHALITRKDLRQSIACFEEVSDSRPGRPIELEGRRS